MNSRYFLSLILAFLFAAGCGQKGPLYLPGNPSEIKTSMPSQQGQADADDDDEQETESRDE